MKNVTMVKVMTLTLKISNMDLMKLVATVDPQVTSEMVLTMLNIDGIILETEETKVMPLPFALAYSHELRERFGITSHVQLAS